MPFVGERVDDGAVGPVVTVAAVHEVLERRLHRVQFLEFLVELLDVRLRQRAHLPARPLAVLPQAEQLADLFDGESPGRETGG
jgi:hypothetical protein